MTALNAGKCPCPGCRGTLTDASLSAGSWRFCRNCRCAWKVSTIHGQAYATSIHSPEHRPAPAAAPSRSVEPTEDPPGG